MSRGRTRRRRGSTRQGLCYTIQEPVFYDPRLPSPFDDLPDEIVVAIVVALGHDLASVARWGSTCKRHHVLAMDAAVWRRLCHVRFGPALHRRFLDVGKDWRWLYEAQARVGSGSKRRGPQTGAALVRVDGAQWVYWGDLLDGSPHGYGVALATPLNRLRCPVRIAADGFVYRPQDRYEGYWKRAKRHGYGVADVGYNGATYDGHWKADKYHGHGVFVRPDVDVYEGAWEAGVKCGHGRVVHQGGDRYEGDWQADCPHGHGTYTWADGTFHVGAWEKGLRHGRGVYTDADGDRYEGDWQRDEIQGPGSMIHADGSRYEGDWNHGRRHGYGSHTVTRQGRVHRYDGQWQRGVLHGYGEDASPDGTYRGLHHCGKRHGYGVMVFPDGAVYEGQWADDVPTGYGTLRCPSGHLYRGWWAEGLMSGQGVCRWDDGSEYAGTFVDDRPCGAGVYVRCDGECCTTTEDAAGAMHALITRSDGFRYEGGWDPSVGSSGHGTCTYGDGSRIVGVWRGAAALDGEIVSHRTVGGPCATDSPCEACGVMAERPLPKS
ncbi:Morn repeat domain containing protein [Pandoravirus salinus]|uniref:Morn repeat domain containing protein n=1 Tax=Pandoravirus salinus TaxID=1349410 RepID=S4W0T4_9VIRU|nr:morn repeat domain [Pandoravirus salinus]AGO85406.1 Morn repeat domain containing protein [Pandoravirus salinus]